MLHRLAIRDFVIVDALEIELGAGLTVLSGETGAGKSILVDALQLALGGRGDAGVVREGAARADISAEFDAPAALEPWLAEAGFEADAGNAGRLLLRRTIDAQGKSRAWVNGSPATAAQLREAGEALVDIHGQHAWQSLTRAPSVRAILDAYAQVDARPLAAAWAAWRDARDALAAASEKQGELERERERLAWQLGEIDKLAPGADEWPELDAEHKRLANAQSLLDAAGSALAALSGSDSERAADAQSLVAGAIDALDGVAAFDERLADPIEALRGAEAQLRDASHTLSSYLDRTELDPERLRAVDERMSAWVGMARRYRRPPAELSALRLQWKDELRALDAAADLEGLRAASGAAQAAYEQAARRISAARRSAAPKLAAAVSRSMQQLGMAGGKFEVALEATAAPQSYGLESAEFLVAGHAGTTPRPLGKVASGGELSRIALAIQVVASEVGQIPTLIFDEVDSGIGGAVAATVGRLLQTLGTDRQVLCVTHLPQVAACADTHSVASFEGAAAIVQTASSEKNSTLDERAIDSLVAHYCRMVYKKTGSLADTARRLRIDRRTVKAHLQRDSDPEFGQGKKGTAPFPRPIGKDV
jgi:DNA repair protein RecN (Recombination protein N)